MIYVCIWYLPQSAAAAGAGAGEGAASAVQCPSGGVNDRVGALANWRRGQAKRKGLTRGNRQPQNFGIVYRARAVGWRQWSSEQRKLLSHVRVHVRCGTVWLTSYSLYIYILYIYTYIIFVAIAGRGWRERVIFFFSVMRHFDTKAQMHIKNAYPKGPTTITATTAVEVEAGAGAAGTGTGAGGASVTISQVSLAKALKYAEISLGSCASCLRLDALPSSTSPVQSCWPKRCHSGQRTSFPDNSFMAKNESAQKKSQLLLGIVSYRLTAGGGEREGEHCHKNVVGQTVFQFSFSSFQFAVFQLSRLTVLVASEAVKTEICISFVPPSPGSLSSPSPFSASALNHPLQVRHLFKHNCALRAYEGVRGQANLFVLIRSRKF